MDLNHVTAFVRVVQDGSFTAAARGLGLPKSFKLGGTRQRARGPRTSPASARELHT